MGKFNIKHPKLWTLLFLVVCPIFASPNSDESYVDLGLSVRWASKNLDILSDSTNSPYYTSSEHIQYGCFRAPTLDEWRELLAKCNLEIIIDKDGREGLLVSGKGTYKDNAIFLPKNGLYSNSFIQKYNSVGYYRVHNMKTPLDGVDYAFMIDTLGNRIGGCTSDEGVPVRLICPLLSFDVSDISMSETEVKLSVGGTYQLHINMEGRGRILSSSVEWSSSNPEIVEVDGDGLLTTAKTGIATVTAEIKGHICSCSVTVYEERTTYVDLGLSVKWAEYNKGAYVESQYGKTTGWHGNLHIASEEQWRELMNECHWAPEVKDGQPGFRVYGTGNFKFNSIFLPFDKDNPMSGYWSNSEAIHIKEFRQAVLLRSSTPFLNPLSQDTKLMIREVQE